MIAWRVIGNPVVSSVIDSGPSSQRREIRRSRVSSPRAAKTDAEPAGSTVSPELGVFGKILLDQPHLDGPAGLVRSECLRPALQWNLIEKPDSLTVSMTPSGTSSRTNSMSVVGSRE